MTCEHGECGCDHDHQVDVTEGQQAEPHGASAGCCGGHHDHDHQVDVTEGQQAEPHSASAGCCGGHHGPETTDVSLGLRSTLP